MIATESFAQIEVDNEADLHAWLAENHAQKESVWLVTYKKSAGTKYLSTDQVLDALLCYGWIDGVGSTGCSNVHVKQRSGWQIDKRRSRAESKIGK